MTDLLPGTAVGASRWPYQAAHPDCWGRPWRGTVLSEDDPRAWRGCLAFPSTPTKPQIRTYLQRLRAMGEALTNKVPVLWAFSDGPQVRWEHPGALRLYPEDLSCWQQARHAARAALRRAA